MPRKLLRDSDRGWYSWEGRFNAVLRMSNAALWATNKKIEKEKHRHVVCLDKLRDEERCYDQRSEDELRDMRNELLEMKAYKTAYERASLRSYYASPEPPQTIFITETKKPKMKKEEQRQKPPQDLKIGKMKWGAMKLKLGYKTETTDGNDSTVEGNSKSTTNSRISNTKFSLQQANFTSIVAKVKEDAYRNQVFSKLKTLQKNDPFGLKSIMNTDDTLHFPYRLQERSRTFVFPRTNIMLDMEGESQRSSDPKVTKKSERKQIENKRALDVRMRVFPENCKNRFSLNQFIEKNKNELVTKWSEPVRKQRKTGELIEKIQFPPVVQRSKTTSAIFRDYKKYRREHDDTLLHRQRALTLPNIEAGETGMQEKMAS
ncbi:uncharacterized protein LOC106153846 [Lingula anatina]|uniref:Uncharacterized protein LOC106153846 n=1 Tax=Lingula anatina TaxID=7574 RepID=A0A1S3HEB4_LINAN|nr:uncharacterized protein LOC106153846 [Lingula anatina]|eukprot:XP_013383409.1 uncharacterized protein LOC106153846 [Lingula anatina]